MNNTKLKTGHDLTYCNITKIYKKLNILKYLKLYIFQHFYQTQFISRELIVKIQLHGTFGNDENISVINDNKVDIKLCPTSQGIKTIKW